MLGMCRRPEGGFWPWCRQRAKRARRGAGGSSGAGGPQRATHPPPARAGVRPRTVRARERIEWPHRQRRARGRLQNARPVRTRTDGRISAGSSQPPTPTPPRIRSRRGISPPPYLPAPFRSRSRRSLRRPASRGPARHPVARRGIPPHRLPLRAGAQEMRPAGARSPGPRPRPRHAQCGREAECRRRPRGGGSAGAGPRPAG